MNKLLRVPVCLLAGGLIVTMLTPVAASADISTGIKVGATSTTVNFGDSPADTIDSRTGIVVGVTGNYEWKPVLGVRLGFQIEGLYAQRGFGDIDLHYLEFPLLLRANVPIGGVGIHFLAGPSFAFLQNCSACPPRGPLVLDTVDIEGLLGAGVDLNLGNGVITVEARYEKSLSDLNGSTSPPFEGLTVKNEALSLTLGYSRRFALSSEEDGDAP